MPISGIVDVDPDGKTAKGRWYGFGLMPSLGGENSKQNFERNMGERICKRGREMEVQETLF